jgi:hypothetical protein
MKTLFTLGDSYMTTDYPDEGIISFTELYARKKGFKHVSLARPGATNFAIRLQIDRAIQSRADYIVLGLTCSDRFDIVVNDAQTAGSYPGYSLDNIYYQNYRAASSQHVDQSDVCIVSDTLHNINESLFQNLVDKNQIAALKQYIAYLHHPRMQIQKDYYMICDGIRKIQAVGIPMILIPTWMQQHDWSWVNRVWPVDIPGPYNMPYGQADWYDVPIYTGTHNPVHAHEECCQTLESITTDWI